MSRSQCLLRNTLERKSDLEDYLEIVREERSEKQKYADCLEQNTYQSLKWLRDYCAVKFPLGAQTIEAINQTLTQTNVSIVNLASILSDAISI